MKIFVFLLLFQKKVMENPKVGRGKGGIDILLEKVGISASGFTFVVIKNSPVMMILVFVLIIIIVVIIVE
jgi:hypothetical protein